MPLGQIRHESLVGVGFLAPQLVIEMNHGKNRSELPP